MTTTLTPAFKIEVSDRATNGRVKFTAYSSKSTEGAARREMNAEGFDVLSIKRVLLNHLGGEIDTRIDGHNPEFLGAQRARAGADY